MPELHLDFETRSAVDLKSAGVYRYAEDPSTSVHCACFAVDDGPVEVWEPGDPTPIAIRQAVDDGWKIVAWNSSFERTIWRLIMTARHGWPAPADDQWYCAAALAAAMALPRDLAGAALALGLSTQKDLEGRRLMLRMAKPRGYATKRPRVVNQRTYTGVKGVPSVYIGRSSKWGNPFKIGVDGTRDGVIAEYRAYLLNRQDLMDALPELREKVLVCHCHPLPCHGDVLADLAATQEPLWLEDRASLDRLIAYCKQDVEVERALGKLLLPLIPAERRMFLLDQEINDRGVLVDLPLVAQSRTVVDQAMKRLNSRIDDITGGAVGKVTQVAKLTRWLQMEGVETSSLDKASMIALLSKDQDGDIQEALETRQEAAKSSTSKLKALAACAGADGRARGMLQFLGAQRTGRAAGRLAQPQNFPRGSLPKGINPEDCIPALMTGDEAIVDAIWAPPLNVVSSTLRSMLMAAPGKALIAADYANIEGRVLAWLAGEAWKLDAFRAFDTVIGHDAKGKPITAGPDLYKLAASAIFGTSVDQVTEAERQIGKTSELACGYGGGVGAFQTMAANYNVVVSDEQADEIKKAWREANPAIVAFWRATDDAAIAAVNNPGTAIDCGPVRWAVHKNFLWCRLPSGRRLCYAAPRIKSMMSVTLKDGAWFRFPAAQVESHKRYLSAAAADEVEHVSYGKSVRFWGVDSLTKRWTEQYGYGGLWTENITQAVARDILYEGMLRLDAAGYHIILSVHDEVVCEEDDAFGSVAEVESILCENPAWLAGCPVTAKGWRARRYRKG